jgi:hypothetical protein
VTIPSGIEMARENTMLSATISAVTGSRSAMASVTSWRLMYERPRSPVTASPSQLA